MQTKFSKEQYDALFNIAISTKSKIDTNKSRLEQLKESKKTTVAEMKGLIEKQNLYESSITILKQIINGLTQNQINHLELLLNESVHTIFYDRNYDISLNVIEQANNNTLQMKLIEHTDDGDIETSIKHNGFGLQAIIGFILQVYYIIYHNQAPILFMDEAFTQLSTQYIPFLKSLISGLVKKYNFIFVLVNHDPRLNELADRVYEVDRGVVTLQSF